MSKKSELLEKNKSDEITNKNQIIQKDDKLNTPKEVNKDTNPKADEIKEEENIAVNINNKNNTTSNETFVKVNQ